jgi:hypothetical protein
MLIENFFLYSPILKPSSRVTMESNKKMGLSQTPVFTTSFLTHILTLISPTFFPLQTTGFSMDSHARKTG